jgi:hypothetical protein
MSIPRDADKICKCPLGFAKNVGVTVFSILAKSLSQYLMTIYPRRRCVAFVA